MAWLIVVTRNASDRLRGFLASSLLEIGPGIYLGARITAGVRGRLLDVVREWFAAERDASVVATWPESARPGGIDVLCLGLPPISLVEVNGVVLARRKVPTDDPPAE